MENRSRVAPVSVLAALALLALPSLAEEPPSNMVEYRLVLVKAGPEESKYLGERRLQSMQEERLEWLAKLHAEGKAIVSGPTWNAGDLREVIILAAGSDGEARKILVADPFVRSGRSVPEIHSWWSDESAFRKTTDLRRLVRTWLVLLRRPAGAPSYDEAKLKEIQAGHMENIRKMAASGDLVAAGPFGDDTALRGIFVLRTVDRERVRALVAQDPAIKAGRLEAEIVAWSVPEGAF